MGDPRLPLAVRLDDPQALDATLVGAKAANLARAAVAGMPTLAGEVLTTAAPVELPDEPDPAAIGFGPHVAEAVLGIWRRVSDGGRHPLVVRSSSTVEDLGNSSMAGRFTSVVGVAGEEAFVDAVRTVLASAVRAARTDGVAPRPMAVLVQRLLRPDCGGVLFGVDPVTGDRRRVVVEVSPLGPEAIVSGTTSGSLARLSRRGRIVDADPEARRLLPARCRRRLVALARRAARRFDEPQDIEWALDRDGGLWMLQTRPITALGTPMRGRGALLGPGPLGETFPLPLRPLEQELWLAPLRDGMREVLHVLGAAGRRSLTTSPVATTVGGWAVCDLDLVGLASRRSGWRALAPAPAWRHLRAAWRVGTLRGTLPQLAVELMHRVDRELADVPALRDLDDTDLVAVLRRGREVLRSVHGHQMLAALLLASEPGTSLAASATAAVRRGRAGGLDDAHVIARWPIALGLVPPRVGGVPLPATLGNEPGDTPAASIDPTDLTTRDGLRLRCRLVQELTARAAGELERRLTARGRLEPGRLAHLRMDELEEAIRGADLPVDLPERASAADTPPVPPAFRLGASGEIVPEHPAGRTRLGGRGAGGGRGGGIVIHDAGGDVAPGSVLVVTTLDPRLAPVIGRLGGLVAETGSVLSHLAILAREQHVPTVVGVDDAVHRFPAGVYLAVDGTTGEVHATAAPKGSR